MKSMKLDSAELRQSTRSPNAVDVQDFDSRPEDRDKLPSIEVKIGAHVLVAGNNKVQPFDD